MDFVNETWPLVVPIGYLFILCVLPGSSVAYSFFYLPYLLTAICFFVFGVTLCVAPPKMQGPGGGGEGIAMIIVLVLSALMFLSATLLFFKWHKKYFFAGAVGVILTLGMYLLRVFS